MEIGLLLYLLLLLVVFGSAVVAGLSAAPFLPTRMRDVRRALDLGKVGPGTVLYDLGCGDGRFVVEAARRGAMATGFEISVLPFAAATARAWVARLRRYPGRVRIRFKNFYHADLSPADVVVCFLTPPAMQRLSTKVARELKFGARLLSVSFHLPGFEPVANDYPGGFASRIFLYRRDPG